MPAQLKIMDFSPRIFKNEKVIVQKMLNKTKLKENNNKFYEAKLEESDSKDYRVVTRYGRIGDSGKIEHRYFTEMVDLDTATKAYTKLVNSKIKGGYEPIDVIDDDTSNNPVNVKNLPPLDKLIVQLYEEAVTAVRQQVETPLGKLSLEQIKKTQKILDDLYKAITNGVSHADLEELSSRLYTNLPQKSPSRLERLPIIDTFKQLEKQIELLDIIKSLVKVQGALNSDAKAKYNATGAKIEILSKKSKEWKRIEKYITETESKHHNVNVHVREIFTVEVDGESEQFNPKGLRVDELFHGSRSANILNILTTGLLIKPKTAIHTGSMFGSGIYFASESTKSTQYAQKWANNKFDSAFLLVCDVAVGNIKEYDDAQPHLSKPPRGYDSVKGVKGRSLLHDEIIVYNKNQVKIKYIVEFVTSRKRR